MVKLRAIVYITESLEISSLEKCSYRHEVSKLPAYVYGRFHIYHPQQNQHNDHTKFFITFRCEVFTAVILKSQVFWYITPCRLVKSYRRFELSQDLQLQSPRVFDCVAGPFVLNIIGDLLCLMNMHNENKCQ